VAIKIDKPFYLPGETIKGVIYIKINKADIGAGTLFIKVFKLIMLVSGYGKSKPN